MTRAQRRMLARVINRPGYTPSRGSTKRTAGILLEHGALEGSIQHGLFAGAGYGVDKKGLYQNG